MLRRCLALLPCVIACAGTPVEAPAGPCVEQTAASEPPQDQPEPETEISEACNTEAHRRFDFWLGSWVVRTADGKLAGHNHVERAHRGCALLEHWRSATGGSGTSTNYFDPQRRAWVQNWIDASGSVIQLEGDLREGEMVLEGRYVQADGTVSTMRGTWTPLEDGRVRQLFETSSDGQSWTPWFEGFYSRE